ncbi:hypothetical protein TAMA11512_10560 [Selenomonas sp. TAMA-11512]|uniref:glutaredoxin n=1 Tax=Selenomonas sp. TAMA-11512 TaxID=3095337 RepID=UPI00308A8EBF|nr:hypothetical protein TAMA11512_10560 [Selenomonas sp. TAMA-11512]
MKKITMIHMEGCPYCQNAFRAIDELKSEMPVYGDLVIETINETKTPELTKPYAGAYYYVPSIFVDGQKAYEAQPGQGYEEIKAHVKEAFEAAR